MKVLHAIPSISLARGGPSYVILNLTKALRDYGVDAEIVTTNDDVSSLLNAPLNQLIEYQGVPIRFFPVFSLPIKGVRFTADRGFLFSTDLTRWLWRHLRDYDLLHTHYLFSYTSTYAGAIARQQKIPYIVRTIGQLSPWALAQSPLKKKIYTSLIERRNLEQAAAIHCTCAGEAEDVRNFKIKTPIITLPLGVDFAENYPEAKLKVRNLYNIPTETPVILFISRLHPKKRPDLLLQSLKKLTFKDYKYHLILAGSGEPEYLKYLTNLISSLNLQSQVSMPGFVTGQDKDILLQGSDMFVLPSFSENFGVAVAEAMAAGLPVIITPEVQIAPEIIAAEAGLVIPGEVEAIAEAIAQLLTSPLRRQQLGENGKRLAIQRYSWKAIAAELVSIYADIKENTSHYS